MPTTKKNHPTPKVLQEVVAYFRSSDDYLLDIEPADDGEELIKDLLGSRGPKDFVPIFKHGSDSLISFWRLQEFAPWPIVWLDSEGSPNDVFAGTVPDLLALLLYDPGFITDALARCDARGVKESRTIPEGLEYKTDALQKYLQEAEERYEGYASFRAWLEREHGIKPMPNPCQYIATKLLAYPDLSTWLTEQG